MDAAINDGTASSLYKSEEANNSQLWGLQKEPVTCYFTWQTGFKDVVKVTTDLMTGEIILGYLVEPT